MLQAEAVYKYPKLFAREFCGGRGRIGKLSSPCRGSSNSHKNSDHYKVQGDMSMRSQSAAGDPVSESPFRSAALSLNYITASVR